MIKKTNKIETRISYTKFEIYTIKFKWFYLGLFIGYFITKLL